MPLIQRSSPLFFIIAMAILGLRCEKDEPSAAIGKPGIVEKVLAIKFQESLVNEALAQFTAAPHPMGSKRQQEIANFLVQKTEALGLSVFRDAFQAEVPNPILIDQPDSPAPLTLTREGQNILARTSWNKPCVIAFGSHYDSKITDGFDYHGANDSGSSSAALLWILQSLATPEHQEQLRCDILAVWFDGEEAVLENWTDGQILHPAKIQDNTYGSRHLAASLTACPEDSSQLCWPEQYGGGRFARLILLDMIGSPQIQISRDLNSDQDLLKLAQSYDQALFESPIITGTRRAIEDDHIPFRQRQLPAINLIDFENLNYWHRPGDDLERLDINSIEKATRLAMTLAFDSE